MTPAEDMATPAEDTLAREIEADMDRHVEEAKAASALEPPADAAAATPADAAVDTPAHDTATCAKCKTEGKVDEMISRPSFSRRAEAHLPSLQCCRDAIPAKRRAADGASERRVNGCILLRMCVGEEERGGWQAVVLARARAMLKKYMVQEVRREKRDGYAGEWQPLTYWELKGY